MDVPNRHTLLTVRNSPGSFSPNSRALSPLRLLLTLMTKFRATLLHSRTGYTPFCWPYSQRRRDLASHRQYSNTTGIAAATAHDRLKVLFFGRDEFSCLVLEQLYAASDLWDDIQLVTQPDMKTGRRGSDISVSPLKLLGHSMRLPVHEIPEARADFRRWRPPALEVTASSSATSEKSHTNPDLQVLPLSHVLITASFGRILSSSLLHQFARGRRLNVHPSLLPKYRGAAPIQHTIMNGDTETGVCITEMMEFQKGIDVGEIWGCKRISVPTNISFAPLRDILAREGGQLLVDVLRDLRSGNAVSHPQQHESAAPRASAIAAVDAIINCSVMTAQHIVRRHKAIAHQKPIVVYLKTQKTLQLHSPAVLTEPPSHICDHLPRPATAIFHPPSRSLIIRCASDTYLAVPEVKQQDRSLLRAKEWWNGVRPEMRLHPGDEGPVQFLYPYPTP